HLFFFSRARAPPRSTPFPYTTLFRSAAAGVTVAPWTPETSEQAGAFAVERVRYALEQRRLPVEVARAATASGELRPLRARRVAEDRKSTRLNSSHVKISYAVFCLKKK